MADPEDRWDSGGRVSSTIPEADVRRVERLRDSWLEAVELYRSNVTGITDPVDVLRFYEPAATAEMRFIAAVEAIFQKYPKLGQLDWYLEEKTHTWD